MPSLLDLRPVRDYLADRGDFFPSYESWRHHVRQHRQELVDAGALVQFGTRYFVDPQRADEVFLEAARRKVAA